MVDLRPLQAAAAVTADELGAAAWPSASHRVGRAFLAANETATGGDDASGDWIAPLVVVVCVVAGLLGLQQLLVSLAHSAIEKYDRDYLGVDIEIGQLSVNVFRGLVKINNLIVKNPSGYENENLLKAKELLLNVGLRKLIRSLGKEIEIQELRVRGIEVNVEFDGHVAGRSNVMTIINRAMEITYPKGDIQPVYDFWHAGNGEHTFHMAPSWPGEVRGHVQFFAHIKQAPGTEPVYDFHNALRREHVFHMGDAHFGERRGEVQFYAYPKQVPGTTAVHEFWHGGNREHTMHMLPAWDREETGSVLFYAHADDPAPSTASKVRAMINKRNAAIKPVYAFWHSRLRQHTFHMVPEWSGERIGTVQFYAYDEPRPGTEAVYDFWNKRTGRKTFHLGDPRAGEERMSALFYVFTKETSGTEAVHEFRHAQNNETNIHLGEPWEGEKKGSLQFYAYRDNPNEAKYIVRRVLLEEITASSSTKLANASVVIDDIRYGDFSWEYNVTSMDEIGKLLARELISKVSVRVGRGVFVSDIEKKKKTSCC